MNCRSCGGNVRKVIDLGMQEPSNALVPAADTRVELFPLEAGVCETCWLMQVMETVPHDVLFDHSYPYFSGTIPAWVTHCRHYVRRITKRLNLTSDSFVAEIGGNDGALLREFGAYLGNLAPALLNIEPSASVAQAATNSGVPTICEPWENITFPRKADLIIANNVMAHTPDLQGFVASLKRNLATGGTITIEFPWVLNLLWYNQFDTIYHEHYSYWSLYALDRLLAHNQLWITDIDRLDEMHGGSLRVYVGHEQPNERYSEWVDRMMASEKPYVCEWLNYDHLRERAARARTQFREYLAFHRPAGYGAAAKGAVFLNYCGATAEQIPYVADTTPAKQGLYLPAPSRIPILTEEHMLREQPRSVVILPWNWKNAIIEKLGPKMPDTTFITCIPHLELYEPKR